jgi:hypothetical protein
MDRSQPAHIDEFSVRGSFNESAIPPKRYAIECVVRLGMGIDNPGPATTTIADMVEEARSKQLSPTVRFINSRLRYFGPVPQDLLVFSRPIDDELTQVVIVDLH